MGLKLLFFVCLAVSASAVSEDDYDSYDGWWSQEVPSADLGIVDSAIDKLVNNDQPFDHPNDYPFYDTPDETPNSAQSEESDDHDVLSSIFNKLKNPESSDEEIISEIDVANDENTNDENVNMDELEQSIKFDIVLGDIDEINDGDRESEHDKPNKEIDDNDYLVEDNRSDVKDEDTRKNDDAPNNDDSFKDYEDAELGINPPEFDENMENIEFKNVQSPDVPSQIIEDAEKILEEENGAYEEDIEGTNIVLSEDENKETNVSELDNIDNDDTKERLDDIVESFMNEMENEKFNESENNDEDDNNGYEDITLLKKYGNDMIYPEETDTNDENINSSEQEDNDEEEHDIDDDDDADTVDKVYEDLNADLDKLFETWDKLIADDSKLSSEETNDENSQLKLEEYEEKYEIPIYNPENFDNVIDSITEDKVKDSDKHVPSIQASQEEEDKSETISKEDEEVIKPDNKENDSPMIDYVEDEKVEETNTLRTYSEKASIVEDVNEKEYANLIYEFSIDHHDNIASSVQEESVFPIKMTLEADKTVEITSPDYPDAYPINNVVDWILEGEEGVQGIELNITDLDLRGEQGDYLLINPGGVMDGQGLLFSYQLPAQTNLRQYRFTSTNRLYIRFNAGSGLNSKPGFRLTVKTIWSQSSDEEEDLPNPEALLPAPASTLTVNLGGLRYPYFYEVKDIFRRIVVDMATMYINANSIDPGMNTTLETAQITNVASCNVNWPSYEECVAVTFGVPLYYDLDSQFYGDPEHEVRLNQEDLISMWMTYVNQDPFAARLRVLGITEFAVPNDSRMITMWAVLGVGVFIAATILGLALWRFSCFAGYSRMKEFDTNSLSQGKRGLDLYPTPHQPLPPLYADSDYKWADAKYDDTTRVDLGGFANRSYARDELLEIDSDEDNIAPRDRYTTDV